MLSGRLVWDEYLFQIKISGLIPQGGRMLELGTGQNTTVMELFGDCYTVVPSDIYVKPDWNAHFPGIMQIDAHYVAFSEAANKDWDAIMLSEVLEHVEDPLRVLDQSREVVKPGGLVVVTTPFNYRIHEFGPDDPETSEPGLKDYWRFTPNGLALLFQKAGFSQFWVGTICREASSELMPDGVVGWAKKSEEIPDQAWVQMRLNTSSWMPGLPEDWRQQQEQLAAEFERELHNVQEVESG